VIYSEKVLLCDTAFRVVVLCIDKTTKRTNGGSQTSNPSAIKPLRKIAPSSTLSSSGRKIPQCKDSISPAAAAVHTAREPRTAEASSNSKSTVTSQHSVCRRPSVKLGCGSGTPPTLVIAHKSSIASKSG